MGQQPLWRVGPLVSFATTGEHTIRIQIREDGMSVDQIVLSAKKYLSTTKPRWRSFIVTPETLLAWHGVNIAAFGVSMCRPTNGSRTCGNSQRCCS